MTPAASAPRATWSRARSSARSARAARRGHPARRARPEACAIAPARTAARTRAQRRAGGRPRLQRELARLAEPAQPGRSEPGHHGRGARARGFARRAFPRGLPARGRPGDIELHGDPQAGRGLVGRHRAGPLHPREARREPDPVMAHAWGDWAGIAGAIFAAYTIFGLTGFGSAVVAVPILVHFVPLTFAVPLVLLLDFGATLAVGALNWHLVARAELLRIVPCMVVGIAAGVTLLVNVEPRWLLLSLGVFVLLNALWNLVRPAPSGRGSAAGAIPAGGGGGVFSARFGAGGPINTPYHARRVDGQSFRATSSMIVQMSGVIRIVTFGGTGLLQQPGLWTDWLWLLPVCALAVFIGSRLHAR